MRLGGSPPPLAARAVRSIRRDNEFLHAPSEAGLARVDVAFRIDGEVVQRPELAGVTAVAGETSERFAVAARKDVDLAALAVTDVNMALRGIGREKQIARVVCGKLHAEKFLHEGSVLLKHLDPFVAAVADVNQSVFRQPHAMNGICE